MKIGKNLTSVGESPYDSIRLDPALVFKPSATGVLPFMVNFKVFTILYNMERKRRIQFIEFGVVNEFKDVACETHCFSIS